MSPLLLLLLAGGSLYALSRRSATPALPEAEQAKQPEAEQAKTPPEAQGPMTLADVEARFRVDEKALLDALAKSSAKAPDELSALEKSFFSDDKRANALAMGFVAFYANDAATPTEVRQAAAKVAIDFRDKFTVTGGSEKTKPADDVLATFNALAANPKDTLLQRAANDAVVMLVRDVTEVGYVESTLEETKTPEATFPAGKVKVTVEAIYDVDSMRAEKADASGKVQTYQGYLARVLDAGKTPLGGSYPVVFVRAKPAASGSAGGKETAAPAIETVRESFKTDSGAMFDAFAKAAIPIEPAMRAFVEDSFSSSDLRAKALALRVLKAISTTASFVKTGIDPSKTAAELKAVADATDAARAAADGAGNDFIEQIGIEYGEARKKLAATLAELSRELGKDPANRDKSKAVTNAYVELVRDIPEGALSDQKIEDNPTPEIKLGKGVAKVALDKAFDLDAEVSKKDAAGKTRTYRAFMARVLDKKTSGVTGEYPIVLALTEVSP